MKALSGLVVSLTAVTGSLGQHVHYEIPEVRHHVQSMLNKFDKYVSHFRRHLILSTHIPQVKLV